jgi:FixJ family two-component response regulator
MQPHSFASVDDFLRSEINHENACVISDIQMPGTSGLDLPAKLLDAGYHLPVIFVTAHDTPESRARAQQVGAAAYFRKPVDAQALLDAIVWALSGQRAA